MNITIKNVSLAHLQNAFGDYGFGLVESMDPHQGIPNHIAIWTNVDGGFEIGRIVKDLGTFPRYTLELETNRIDEDRLSKLLGSFVKSSRHS